ncbi:MAG: SH3 domain-containing protein [Clostridiales bacterium]|nr:SH3 domain-containing protein [Clostridiales bacterium]
MKAKVRAKVMATAAVLAVAAFLVFALAGCSLVKEGVTGEKSDEGQVEADREEVAPAMPAAYNIVGEWFGVYSGSEYLSFRFTADGKCEMQPALYPSDMFGPKYYGDYSWGGEGGKEILLDLYRGVSNEVDYGDDGGIWDEWSDGGRDSATIALTMAFRVYGADMRSFALKANAAGTDTEGYLVVQANAFLVVLESHAGSGNPSPFMYGAAPYDMTEGKEKMPMSPDSFLGRAERFFTTDELNVRCGPSTDFATYGTVMPGTPVDQIGYMDSGHDDWAFVLLEDGGGWVNTGYLSDAPPGAATQEAPQEDNE